eukprot:gene21489-25849_t
MDLEVWYRPGEQTTEVLNPRISNGSCSCEFVYSSLVIGGEDLNMDISDQYIDTFGTKGTLDNTLVHIRVEGSEEDKQIFDVGVPVELNLAQLLAWSELDLDRRASESPNSQWLANGERDENLEELPYLRAT